MKNFFLRYTKWTNAELALIKICLICFGIFVGICLYKVLQDYAGYFFLVFVITAIWVLVLWIKKMNQDQ